MPVRKTDLFAAIGVLMLLVWTPSYYAQDPLEREHTGGTTFTLPEPRDGDRAVLELQVQEDGGPVIGIGPVVEVRFERTGPNDPPGAVWKMVFDHLPAAAETKYLDIQQGQRWVSHGFDEMGLLVWTEYGGRSAVRSNGGIQDWQESVRVHGASCRAHALNGVQSDTFRYVSDQIGWHVAQFRAKKLDGMQELAGCNVWSPGVEGSVMTVAAEMGPHPLYGRFGILSSRIMEQWESDLTGQPMKTCAIEAGNHLLSHPVVDVAFYKGNEQVDFGLGWALEAKGPIEYSCDLRAPSQDIVWMTPDFPFAVGSRQTFLDPAGTPFLKIDLVPRLIERGDGEPFPIDTTRGRLEPSRYEEPVPHSARSTLEQGTIRHLEDHDVRLAHGVTFEEIREAIRAEADPEAAAFVAQARIIRFSWSAEGPEPYSVTYRSLPEPLGGLVEEQVGMEKTSTWAVTFARPDGASLTCDVRFIVRDVPASRAGTVGPRCADTFDVEEDVADWDRDVVLPGPLLDLIERRHPSISLREPGRGMTSTFTWGDPDESGILGVHFGRGGDRYRGVFDLGTGRPLSEELDSETSERWSGPVRTEAAETTHTPAPLTPIATTAAYAGVVLVLFSLLARFYSGIKSGAIAAGAAGLYAKIRKDALLDHERRDAILNLVRADPGISLQEVQKRLGYGWGSTVHHVETLRRNGLLADLRVHGSRRLFLADTTPEERRRILASRDPQMHAFITLIQEHPGLPLHELASRLERDVSAASRLGSKLDALGVVEKRKSGRVVHFYPKEPGSPRQ